MMTGLASLDMSALDQYICQDNSPAAKGFTCKTYFLQIPPMTSEGTHFIFFALHRKHDVCGRFRVMMPVFVRFLGGSSEAPRDPAVAETPGCGVCPSRLSRY